MLERHHRSIGGGADGCGLNDGGDAEEENLSDGGSGVAAEAGMQRMEPGGLTLWFLGVTGARKTTVHLDPCACHDLLP